MEQRRAIGESLLPRRQRSQSERNILNLFLDTASQGVLAGGILSYIAIFVARLGGSSLLISLLTALPALGVILFSMPAAQFVSRRRDMVRITVISRIIIHSLYLLIALIPFVVQRHLAPLVVVLWALQALPSAVANVSWTEVIAQAVPLDRLARVNGARWASYSVIIAISVAGFGALLERLPQPINYQIVFFVSALSGFTSAYFFSRIRLDERNEPRTPAAHRTWKEQWRGLTAPLTESRPFQYYLIVGFLIRLGMYLPAALYTVFWVNTLRASDQWIGLRSTAGNLALVVGYMFWGRAVSRTGHMKALVICGVGMALYPALTALVNAPVWLIPVAVVWGFTAGGIDITLFEGLLRISPAATRTSYVAINTVIANLAVFLGPILGSFVSDGIGIRPAFFVSMAVGVVGAALVGVWRVGEEPEP